MWFDEYGNLVWTVSDPTDGIAADQKRVVYFDGHSDTVQALRSSWLDKLGGIDAYDGLLDLDNVDREFLRSELGHLPPDDEWEHLVFGRGSADQLGGVISQILATKIALELAPEGALRGVIVRAYATVAEEDNDGGGPMFDERGAAGRVGRPHPRRGRAHRGHRRRGRRAHSGSTVDSAAGCRSRSP